MNIDKDLIVKRLFCKLIRKEILLINNDILTCDEVPDSMLSNPTGEDIYEEKEEEEEQPGEEDQQTPGMGRP